MAIPWLKFLMQSSNYPTGCCLSFDVWSCVWVCCVKWAKKKLRGSWEEEECLSSFFFSVERRERESRASLFPCVFFSCSVRDQREPRDVLTWSVKLGQNDGLSSKWQDICMGYQWRIFLPKWEEMFMRMECRNGLIVVLVKQKWLGWFFIFLIFLFF